MAMAAEPGDGVSSLGTLLAAPEGPQDPSAPSPASLAVGSGSGTLWVPAALLELWWGTALPRVPCWPPCPLLSLCPARGQARCSGRRSLGCPGRLPGRSRNGRGNHEWVREQSAADAELWWGLGGWRHRVGMRGDTARAVGLAPLGTAGHIRAATPGHWAGSGGLHSKPSSAGAGVPHSPSPWPSSAAPAPLPRVSNAELQR